MKLKSISLASLVLISSAFSHEAAFASFGCQDLDELNAGVKNCQGNRAYVDSAQDCLDRFDTFVGTGSKALAKALQSAGEATDKSGNSQLNYYGNDGTDLGISLADVTKMIARGEKTSELLEDYLDNIVFPEEFDAPPSVIGNDPEAYFNANKCYAEAKKGIEDLLDKLDGQLDKLDDTKDALAKFAKTNSGRTTNSGSLGSQNNPQLQQQDKTKAVKTKKTGNSANPSSNVTGVEEDLKAEQKSNK
jgi:hypothetical protein